ncbi:MAG: DNA-directed RNA polymerase III subunit RPC6, partial [Paramarteilia canceri]
ASSKKLYMVYNLEPDSSISGGTFYTNQELDTSLIESLSENILIFLQYKCSKYKNSQRVYKPEMFSASVEQVLEFLKEKSLTEKKISLNDIKKLLEILVFDQKAFRVKKGDEV